MGDADTGDTPLDGAGLSTRTLNTLRRSRGARSASPAVRAPRERLLELNGIGPLSLLELDAGLARLGYPPAGAWAVPEAERSPTVAARLARPGREVRELRGELARLAGRPRAE